MKSKTLALLILLTAGLAACDRDELDLPDPEPPPAPIAEPEIPAVEEPPAAFEPPPVEFLGWPGHREDQTFGLTWLGGDEPLPLREAPSSESSVISELQWYDGEELPWDESRVRVLQPSPLVATESFSWTATPYDEEFLELESSEVILSVATDQPVFFYHLSGENLCFFALDHTVHLGDCIKDHLTPAEDHPSPADPLRPLEHQWWVLIDADDAYGWLLIDDDAPIEVFPREIEGMERFDDEDDGPPFR